MPTYDYACAGCGGFDAIRSLAQRNEPAACPDCGAAAARVFVTAPRLALMASSTRNAIATNERARHEPKSSRDYARLKHPAGCGCCSTGKRGATLTGANGNKAFPGKRPWMISH
ncbi:MAG: zinc ribbon domain-containing protein [Bacteriovorax sp.]|nr:zinc ribbon domain-containing protein [Rhizobacter sp.]